MTTFKSKTAQAVAGLVTALFVLVGANTASAAYNFTTNLSLGSTGEAVKQLQMVLNMSADTQVAATGVGSSGMESSYFGGLTKSAVIKFQNKYASEVLAPAGLTSGTGFVGAYTRAKLSILSAGGTPPPSGTLPLGCAAAQPVQMYSALNGAPCIVGGTTPPVAGSVTASLASDNPSAGYVATGTANNPVLKINVSNGSATALNVTGVKVTKSGFYANTNVTGVSAYDASGVRHGNVVTTLGADGVATLTFGTQPIMVAAGQSATILIRANIAAGSSTGTINFSVANPATDIMLSAGTVAATGAISGNLFSIVDGSNNIGSVTVDVQPVNTSGITVNADGTSIQEVTKFRIVETSSDEDVRIHKLTLWNNGNAADSDLRDVQLFDQSDVLLATAQMSNKSVTFDLSAAPYLITEGQTKDFKVKAKFVDGASRTVQFVVYNDYDVDVRGVSTGAGILPTYGSIDTSFPIGDTTSTYNKVTIGSGSLILSRASDSPSTSVTPAASNIVLAKYNARPVGESMEMRGISFGIYQDTSTVDLTGTVYVKVNGSTVFSGAASGFAGAGTVAARSLSSYPILTAGQDNAIEIIVTVSSSATSADAYYVNDFDITSVKRLITNDITDPSVSAQDGFTRSVQSAALTVTTLTTPVATTIIPGSVDNHLASIEFNAQSSGEPVRVASVVIADTIGGSAVLTDMYNLVMKDASGNIITTTSSTSTNAATVTFNLTNAIIVTPTTPVTIKLYGSVISGATTGATSAYAHTYDVSSVTATGDTTGNSISSPTVTGAGQAMMINSGGSLTLSTVTGTGYTPSLVQLVSMNQLDGTYLAGRFTAQYEAQKVTTLTLEAAGTALSSNNIKNIRLYAQNGTGPLLVGTMPFATIPQFTCSSNVCAYTLTNTDNVLPMQVSAGTPVTMFVKADVEGENVAKLGDDFYFRVQSGADVVAKGALSQSTTTETGNFNDSSTAVSRIVPFNVVVSGEYPSSGSTTQLQVAAGTQIGRFKITNNGGAQVTFGGTSTVFTVADNGSHTNTDLTYSLYVSDENSNNYTGTLVDNDGTDNTAGSIAFGLLDTTFTLNGGAYRYVTVTVLAGTIAANDTWNLGVSALGNVTYSVAESALGYDGEQDGDITGTIAGLYTDGKPSLGTIQDPS